MEAKAHLIQTARIWSLGSGYRGIGQRQNKGVLRYLGGTKNTLLHSD